MLRFVREQAVYATYFVLLIVYGFVLYFFGGAPAFYVLATLVLGLIAAAMGMRSRNVLAPPILLGALMAGVIFQTPYLSEMGLTTHTTWRKFAEEIHQENHQPYTVGVVSHDLHEKELQIYFPENKIGKYGNDNDKYTAYMINKLFGNRQRVYCLITENDYNKYLKEKNLHLEVVRQEFMLRKRLNIDRHFFTAFLRLDRRTIFHYFMENVYLIRRDRRA